jgi:RNA polymerase sigma-70 factor, ECF subfamily
MPDAPSRRCLTCPFRCPGVCSATPSQALRAACRAQACDLASDESLIRRHLESADPSTPSPALGLLFERHYRYVVAAVCRITGRLDLARDLAQEVFIKALLNIDRYRLDASFTTWLFAIARNCCYDHAKAAATRKEVVVDPAELPSAAVENGALRALEAKEAKRILFRLMKDARLDKTETRAFGLHYGGGMPLDAVTEHLQLRNRSGAKARIVSARRKLNRAVERWERLTGTQGTMTPLRIA